MPWDAVAELSSLLERFRQLPVGWNCELLNARWRNFRHDSLCEGGLWLPLPSEPGKSIPGFVYLYDETLGQPAHKNERQACYSTATELAAEEFRQLATRGGGILTRIPQLKSELQSLVDGGGVGPPADHERWWLAYLFREVASEIVGRDLNVEAVGLGKGLTYEVAIEGVFGASEAACEWLIESFAPVVVTTSHQSSLTVEGPSNSDPKKKRPPKEPSPEDFAAYKLYVIGGIKQEQVAKELERAFGKPFHQGGVSRSVGRVRTFLNAGGIMSSLEQAKANVDTVDPSVIEMGARQDGQTHRQRKSADDE